VPACVAKEGKSVMPFGFGCAPAVAAQRAANQTSRHFPFRSEAARS
jgi:hypothetical protein